MTPEHDELVRDVTVEVPLGRAFTAFTDGIGAWWPAAFTFSGTESATVRVEGGSGGHWYERAGDGSETSWGEVRAWDPPRRAVFAWRVGADRGQEPPERASEVEVRFEAVSAQRTRVVVRHSAFARHGAGAATMRAGMASPQGWTALLERYRRSLT